MYRSPVGPAGRGPQRVWRVTDFDNWGHAVCGRLLAEYERDLERRGTLKGRKGRQEPRPEGG